MKQSKAKHKSRNEKLYVSSGGGAGHGCDIDDTNNYEGALLLSRGAVVAP